MPIEVFYFRAHVNRPKPISVRGTTKETSYISIPTAEIMDTTLPAEVVPLQVYLKQFKTKQIHNHKCKLDRNINIIQDPDLVHLSDRNR